MGGKKGGRKNTGNNTSSTAGGGSGSAGSSPTSEGGSGGSAAAAVPGPVINIAASSSQSQPAAAASLNHAAFQGALAATAGAAATGTALPPTTVHSTFTGSAYGNATVAGVGNPNFPPGTAIPAPNVEGSRPRLKLTPRKAAASGGNSGTGGIIGSSASGSGGSGMMPLPNPADAATEARRLAVEVSTFAKMHGMEPGIDIPSEATLAAAAAAPAPPPGTLTTTSTVATGFEGLGPPPTGPNGQPQIPLPDPIGELQLAAARRLRNVLPTHRTDLLRTAQEKNWIPVLLGWLNLHNRPAVQVEALLALTNIAEYCAANTAQTGQPLGLSSAAPAAGTVAAAAAAAVAPIPVAAAPAGAAGAAAQPNAAAYYSFPSPTAGLGSGGAGAGAGSGVAAPATTGMLPAGAAAAPGGSDPASIAAAAAANANANASGAAAGSAVPGASASLSPAASTALASAPPGSLLSSAAAILSGAGLMPPGTPIPGMTPGTPGLPGLAGLTGNAGPGSSSAAALNTIPPPLSPSSQHLLLRHADAIPTLISLLSSPNREVHEQALWILGSIAAGDGPGGSSGGGQSGGSGSVGDIGGSNKDGKNVAARDVVLAAGVMNPLLRCMEFHPTNLSLQRIGAWTLSNLVEGQFQQPPGGSGKDKNSSSNRGGDSYSSSDEIDIRKLLPSLRRLLSSADAEVLSYTCWTLSHLCDGPSSHIAAVVTTPPDVKGPPGGLVPRLVELLLHASWRVTKPALRTIGNIVCAECTDDSAIPTFPGGPPAPTDYTEVILDCDAVPRLKQLITHSNREIQKEACWTLSNIAAGTVGQIQAVIDSGAIGPLVKLVGEKTTDQEVRSEACWVVLNATSCGSDRQIEVLVEEGCVSVLGVLLGEPSMVMMALEGLERVLQVEEGRELAKRSRGGGDSKDDDNTPLVSASLIEKALDKHNSSAVSKRAGRIWKQHFVSCALCHESFSRHRPADAHFCNECKCHVCSNCDCKVYHLSYQEELWATEEGKNEASKKAKKNKKAKKKAKAKEKKAKADAEEKLAQEQEKKAAAEKKQQKGKKGQRDGSTVRSRSSTTASSNAESGQGGKSSAEVPPVIGKHSSRKGGKKSAYSATNGSGTDEDDDDTLPLSSPNEDGSGNKGPDVDFVLYLEQTGSIIALAKLMDALDDGEENGEIDPELEAELKALRI
mmetsp:Transcript_13244/g.28066  ORF Transcript_13244/g.28066 Transcript_13244/m.28066 type:complete len:1178 (-) Transcript_13244:173-3706(-)